MDKQALLAGLKSTLNCIGTGIDRGNWELIRRGAFGLNVIITVLGDTELPAEEVSSKKGFCPRCGNEELAADATFCKICGMALFAVTQSNEEG